MPRRRIIVVLLAIASCPITAITRAVTGTRSSSASDGLKVFVYLVIFE